MGGGIFCVRFFSLLLLLLFGLHVDMFLCVCESEIERERDWQLSAGDFSSFFFLFFWLR